MKGLRIGIYARYSSDRQSDASIEDQVHRARELIGARGGEPDRAQVFADYAVSGASMDRPGMAPLLEAIRVGHVDLVVTESVDRVSRDIGDADRFRKLLVYRGVGLECLDGTRVAVGGDKSDALTFGIRALFAEQYRLDLADKTRRGLEGRARVGAPTGAVAYGFRIVNDASGRRIELDRDRADVVRRIFGWYAAGDSLATIAERLNAEGVVAPRAHKRRAGDGWMHTAVRSMLLNERYRGLWEFGRREWVKAPGQNQRRPKVRRGGPTVSIERPELAIVDQQTWAAVQARFARHTTLPRARRSYMLSGLLHCGVCGGRMGHNGGSSQPYFACSAAVKRRTCPQRRNVPVQLAERMVVERIQSELESCIEDVCEVMAEELLAWRAAGSEIRAQFERKLETLARRARGLIEHVMEAGPSAESTAAMRAIEGERAELRARLASLSETERSLPPLDEVMRRVYAVSALPAGPADHAREALRPLLEDGKLYCELTDAHEWRITWGLLPGVLVTGRPPLALGRASDTGGCGGVIRPVSDALVRRCEVTLAA